jgi:hypothetical protein
MILYVSVVRCLVCRYGINSWYSSESWQNIAELCFAFVSNQLSTFNLSRCMGKFKFENFRNCIRANAGECESHYRYESHVLRYVKSAISVPSTWHRKNELFPVWCRVEIDSSLKNSVRNWESVTKSECRVSQPAQMATSKCKDVVQ